MKTALLDRVRRYLAPMPDRELTVTMDRQSLRNISHVSLTACIFETLILLIFTTIAGWRLDRQEVLVSVLSVGFCALFSLAVYLIIPVIDAMLSRVKLRYLAPICLVLLATFAGDLVFSHYHPNVGDGITDYDAYQEETGIERMVETAYLGW